MNYPRGENNLGNNNVGGQSDNQVSSEVEDIFSLEITVSLLGPDHAEEVFLFLQKSQENHGPFFHTIRQSCSSCEDVAYQLGPWDDYNKPHNLYFGCFSSTGEMIGGIVSAINPEKKEVELGGFAGKDQKGRGFGKQSIVEVVQYFQKNGGIEKIIATVADPYNISAIKMLDSCGFSVESYTIDGTVFSKKL